MDPIKSNETSTAEQPDTHADCQHSEETHKKKRTFGAVSLLLALITLLGLLGFCVYAFFSYRAGTLAGSDVRLALGIATGGIVLSTLSLLTALISLFLHRQRKGMSVAGAILSLLLLTACALGLYAYHYMFGTLTEGERFDRTKLNVVQVDEDGAILRENEPPATSVSPDEINAFTFDQEIEWEAVSYDDLPEGARALLEGTQPSGPSYLLEGSDQITNVLLFGLDIVGSSDSIILISIDNAHQKIKVISIPRDTYALIPEWGTYAKLAYPYYWGGPQMAIGTVNRNLSLNVRDYIAIRFSQFSEIVDMVGGVDIELNADEVWYLRDTQSGLKVGTCHLNGRAATIFSKMRKSSASDTEINRTERQREVLVAVMNAIKEMPIGEYPGFIRFCLGLCTTNFSSNELLDIALKAAQGNYTIESYALLENVPYWGGVFGKEQYFYCVYDLHRASDWLYRTIYEDLYISGYPEE